MLVDAAYYGVDQRIIQSIHIQQSRFDVWPENWEALSVFLEVADQWDYPPQGGRPFRLNAHAVFSWLDVSGRRKQARKLWSQIQLIADGALEAWRQADEQ